MEELTMAAARQQKQQLITNPVIINTYRIKLEKAYIRCPHKMVYYFLSSIARQAAQCGCF